MPLRRVKKPPIWKGRASSLPVDHFGRMDVRVGIIRDAMEHPRLTGRHYLLAVNFGEVFSVMITATLFQSFTPEELTDKLVVGCLNMKSMWFRSNDIFGHIFGSRTSEDRDGVELLIPPVEAVPGDIISVSGYEREPDIPFMNPDSKIFESINFHNKVDSRSRVLYRNSPWMIKDKPGCVHTKTIQSNFVRVM